MANYGRKVTLVVTKCLTKICSYVIKTKDEGAFKEKSHC